MLPAPAGTVQETVALPTGLPHTSCIEAVKVWVPPAGTLAVVGETPSAVAGPTVIVRFALALLPFAVTVTPFGTLPGVQEPVSRPFWVIVPAAAVACQA